jgi:hypothetical protein
MMELLKGAIVAFLYVAFFLVVLAGCWSIIVGLKYVAATLLSILRKSKKQTI